MNSQQADPQQHELLRVCRIGRAQGLKGEVNVTTLTDEPERRFATGSVLIARAPRNRHSNGNTAADSAAPNTGDGASETHNVHTTDTGTGTDTDTSTDRSETSYVVQSARFQKNRWVLKFTEVNDRTAAEALRGTDLYAEADDAEAMADEDAWYPKDLIGLTAVMAEGNGLKQPAGTTIGTVVDVNDTGAQWLLKIRLTKPAPNGETTALVPFVEAIVPKVSLEHGILTLDPPGGLIPGL